MKSNPIRFVAFHALVLGGLLACFGAASAGTQQAPGYQGSFTLLYAVQCGRTLLAPGTYAFHLDPSSADRRISIRGERGEMSVKPWGISRGTLPGENMMVVRRDGDRRVVEAIYLGDLDLVLYFGPNAKQRLARDPDRIEHLPILWTPQGECPHYCLG